MFAPGLYLDSRPMLHQRSILTVHHLRTGQEQLSKEEIRVCISTQLLIALESVLTSV